MARVRQATIKFENGFEEEKEESEPEPEPVYSARTLKKRAKEAKKEAKKKAKKKKWNHYPLNRLCAMIIHKPFGASYTIRYIILVFPSFKI